MNKIRTFFMTNGVYCLIVFCLCIQVGCSKQTKYHVSVSDASQILIGVKNFVSNNFVKSTESGKTFLSVSREFNKDISKIVIVGNNIFTVKNSCWLFFVQTDSANGTYIGEKYFAYVILGKQKNQWKVIEGGIFLKKSGRGFSVKDISTPRQSGADHLVEDKLPERSH